jgi:hypothetical protein
MFKNNNKSHIHIIRKVNRQSLRIGGKTAWKNILMNSRNISEINPKLYGKSYLRRFLRTCSHKNLVYYTILKN